MAVRDEAVSFSLEVNVEKGLTDLRKVETVLYRTLALAEKLGLADTAEIRAKLALLNRVRLAYLAVQAARMAAGDPLAWATAGLAVVETGVSMYSMFEYETRGR